MVHLLSILNNLYFFSIRLWTELRSLTAGGCYLTESRPTVKSLTFSKQAVCDCLFLLVDSSPHIGILLTSSIKLVSKRHYSDPRIFGPVGCDENIVKKARTTSLVTAVLLSRESKAAAASTTVPNVCLLRWYPHLSSHKK